MTLANFEKDLAIIAAFARQVGARTPLFSAAAPIYAAAARKNPSLDTGAVCAVLETERERRTRIISARQATARERKDYEENSSKGSA